ncbi:LCP family protein, partial [Saccharomonospora saliphila]|uniref:LCP family protein n=1 Tax=Saccharomonospora saliphila TaxID=369829 RepID=UPI00036E976A
RLSEAVVAAAVNARTHRTSRGAIAAVGAAVALAVAAAVVLVPRLVGDGHNTVPPAASPAPTTVLLAGMDGTGHSDSLVLARFGPDSVNAVSVPRDSLVAVPGHGRQRVSSAYLTGRADARDAGAEDGEAARAGARLLTATVSELTGTTIDHVAMVEMSAFATLADEVGGVEVCVRAAHHDRYSGARLQPGSQRLTGTEVLAFLRQRHGLPEGDLDRIVRMQAVLRAWTHAAVTDGWSLGARADRLASLVTEHVRIEPALDVLGLARRVASLDETDLRIATIPVAEAETTMSGTRGLAVDPVEVRAFTRAFLDGAGESAGHAPPAAPHTTLPPGPAPCVD